MAVVAVVVHPRFAEHLLAEAAGPVLVLPVKARVRAGFVPFILERVRAGAQSDDGHAARDGVGKGHSLLARRSGERQDASMRRRLADPSGERKHDALREGETAIRWVNGAPELLGVLAGSETSVALDASGDGSIVVGYCASLNLPKRAFIWDSENGMRDLQEVLIDRGEDLTGWELREAAGISDDGLVIVGTGINPESRPRGWVTAPVLPTPTPTPTPTPVPTPTPTPVPEPGQWLQLVSGLLGLGMLGKGRRVSHQGSISPHQESGRGWRCAKSPTALAKLWWS